MSRYLALVFMLLTTTVGADTVTTVTKQYSADGEAGIGIPIARHALDHLHISATKACPSGWEKLREYTTRDGEKYFLNFEIRCLGAAPSAAK